MIVMSTAFQSASAPMDSIRRRRQTSNPSRSPAAATEAAMASRFSWHISPKCSPMIHPQSRLHCHKKYILLSCCIGHERRHKISGDHDDLP
ncbi:hypothetical protein M378DRAFT_381841 [Amanita muscaria Koide BX008]|uniref:Uncharacterized protein n=1 Tax=Amanita muscaria (strain Koide BX008) TaxID=946122 RepID=A0A0C2WLC2_AMAMK|nr:hypothetical protein M378DRAFT_381841 [Amanita muscaria Koide BX008]